MESRSTDETLDGGVARKEVRTMVFYAVAVIGFVVGLPGELFFWGVDSVQMMVKHEETCKSADQTIGDYLVKGHWTEAPWRPVCKE
jgi:hypothetical protein